MIENIVEHLKEHGVKPSLQRIKILEHLNNNHNHPTVEMIYNALINEIPTLSKTTIYNTLNLLVEKKLVNMIVIEEKETRYEIMDEEHHGHFKCKSCGDIIDFYIEHSNLNIDKLKNVDIDEIHFYLKGKCNNCKREG